MTFHFTEDQTISFYDATAIDDFSTPGTIAVLGENGKPLGGVLTERLLAWSWEDVEDEDNFIATTVTRVFTPEA